MFIFNCDCKERNVFFTVFHSVFLQTLQTHKLADLFKAIEIALDARNAKVNIFQKAFVLRNDLTLVKCYDIVVLRLININN